MNVQRKCAKKLNTEIHLSVNNVICHVNSNAVTDTKSSLTTIQQLWDILQKHSFGNLFFFARLFAISVFIHKQSNILS